MYQLLLLTLFLARSMYQLLVTADVVPSSLITSQSTAFFNTEEKLVNFEPSADDTKHCIRKNADWMCSHSAEA
jgi:hypothetical protein